MAVSTHETNSTDSGSRMRVPQLNATQARAGALMSQSSCLDGGITRVGPGQHPRYTRADFGQEAVRGSRPQQPTTPRMVAETQRTHEVTNTDDQIRAHGSGACYVHRNWDTANAEQAVVAMPRRTPGETHR